MQVPGGDSAGPRNDILRPEKINLEEKETFLEK